MTTALLFIFLLVPYALLIGAYAVSWLRIREFIPVNKASVSVSIIVPARNEEANIEACLQSLCAQDYPRHLFELIVIDDLSEDATAAKVQAWIASHPEHRIRLIQNTHDGSGSQAYKKQAIASAIGLASGSLIITSDADCNAGPQWLPVIASYYEQQHPKMIAGPVCYQHERNWFERMQTLEFLGLIGCGAAALRLGAPLMCNGANLAYEKEAFLEVGGFNNTDNTASGDDTFLMFKINSRFPGKVHFLKNKEAFVYTTAKATLAEFISQRTRWASKTTRYDDIKPTLVGIITYLVNLALLCTGIKSIFDPEAFHVFAIAFLFKCFTDGLLLLLITKFAGRVRLLWLLLPEQVLYTLYVVYVGTVSPFSKYKWKGRVLK